MHLNCIPNRNTYKLNKESKSNQLQGKTLTKHRKQAKNTPAYERVKMKCKAG